MRGLSCANSKQMKVNPCKSYKWPVLTHHTTSHRKYLNGDPTVLDALCCRGHVAGLDQWDSQAVTLKTPGHAESLPVIFS